MWFSIASAQQNNKRKINTIFADTLNSFWPTWHLIYMHLKKVKIKRESNYWNRKIYFWATKFTATVLLIQWINIKQNHWCIPAVNLLAIFFFNSISCFLFNQTILYSSRAPIKCAHMMSPKTSQRSHLDIGVVDDDGGVPTTKTGSIEIEQWIQ